MDHGWDGLRLADLAPITTPEATALGHGAEPRDIANRAACKRCGRGIETVLHLAADSASEMDCDGSLPEDTITNGDTVDRSATDEDDGVTVLEPVTRLC